MATFTQNYGRWLKKELDSIQAFLSKHMNYYRMYSYDQVHTNRLLFTEHTETPWVRLKPRYAKFVCPKCHRFDHDIVFDEGFDAGILIRAKGDYITTDDNFHCFSDKITRIILSNGIKGVALKPLEGTAWHVLNVSRRVNANQSIYTYSKATCQLCGRPRSVTGSFDLLSQIDAPQEAVTFFAPTFDRCGYNCDRDLFATEDIVMLFKNAGIRGILFTRLLRADEEGAFKEAVAAGKEFKWPKGSQVILD